MRVWLAGLSVVSALSASDLSGYTAAAVCERCHRDIAHAYHQVSMAQTFGQLDAFPAIEDFSSNTFEHRKSEQYYRVIRRGGRTFQERYELNERGEEVRSFSLEATHLIGSGKRARSYLNRSPGGQLIQLPLTWYSQEQRWAMSPGYDQKNNFGFTRVVEPGCIFCHSAYPANTAAAFASRTVWPVELPSGIDCQRCHGLGANHVKLASTGAEAAQVRLAIVNPRRLTPSLQLDVCLQCHLQTTSAPLPHALRRFGKDVFSYRPGQRLDEYLVMFDHAAGSAQEDKFEVNGAGYRLLQSPCFLKSGGKLTCITCHSPHQSVAATSKACLSCHVGHSEAERVDCVSCHMPKRRTEDAVHVVLTDHRIQRNPAIVNSLAPLEEKSDRYRGKLQIYRSFGLSSFERALYLGLALASDSTDLHAGTRLLRETLTGKSTVPIEARMGFARALAQEDRLTEALAQCRIALATRPQLSGVRAECAKVQENIGDRKGALAQYRQALAQDPGLASAAFGAAGLTEDRNEAIGLYRLASLDISLRAQALTNLGNLFTTPNDFAVAHTSLNEALALDSGLPAAENNLGRLYAFEGNQQEALHHVERAIELNKNFYEARFNYAQLLQSAGRSGEAIEQYRRVVLQKPDLAAAHLGLGSILGDAGQIEEAILEFRTALRLSPGNPEAKKNLDLAEQIQREKHN